MPWRHLCMVRAWSAAGLLTYLMVGAPVPARAELEEPVPTVDAGSMEPVSVLEASKAGDLDVLVRGAGQDRVRLSLKNTSSNRLKVVLPPGLVASSTATQGRGFQSMGLGALSNRPGSFGAFKSSEEGTKGFRSVKVRKGETTDAMAIPAGKTVDLTLTAVCLNFGIRTPGANDRFELKDVDDYTNDPRARKALRSLATFGTSQGVAQAAMWRVCNDVPFGAMLEPSVMGPNRHEVALAARFVEALDASGSSDLVDPAYLTQGRLFVRVVGTGSLAQDAQRLSEGVEGLKILGLSARGLDRKEGQTVEGPAVLLTVVLADSQRGQTRGRIVLSQSDEAGHWTPIGKTTFQEGSASSVLDGASLARLLDRNVARAFVSVKTARRSSGSTMLKVENRLPFTLANVTLKAGTSPGAPSVPFPGVGIAPARSALVPVQAPGATVDHVEFNGL
ncbi:MAG: hypothetical protein NVSMB9_16950 [Isosphaeraceae bacterium]